MSTLPEVLDEARRWTKGVLGATIPAEIGETLTTCRSCGSKWVRFEYDLIDAYELTIHRSVWCWECGAYRAQVWTAEEPTWRESFKSVQAGVGETAPQEEK